MDLTDKKIIAELDANPKIPLTQLAKRLRISQQVADYRVKRLFKEKTILKLTPIINLKALGYQEYRLFFTFNALKQFTTKDIFSYLQKQKGIYWSARVGGRYDLVVVLWVEEFAGFDLFVHNLNNQFPGLLKGYKACYVLNHHIFRHKYLCHDYSQLEYNYNDKKQEIDELDYDILQRIKNDCRVPALSIALEKKISYKTVIHRIKSMEAQKVILGYRMYFKSAEELRRSAYIVLFSFKNYSQQNEKDFFSYVKHLDDITQAMRLFGLWDSFLNVRSPTNENVQEMVIQLRDKFDIIDEYEIIPVFEDLAIDLLPL